MPDNNMCRMHEGIAQRVATLERKRREDRTDIRELRECIEEISERLVRIETRVGVWAGAGGIIGGAIAVALTKIVLG